MSTEIVEKAPQEIEAQAAPTSFVASIEKIIADPNIDLDKLERFMDLHKRAVDQQALTEFNLAFADMQKALPIIEERGLGHQKNKYALWEDINKAITPVLSSHGFALTFQLEQQQDSLNVTGTLTHKTGHSISNTLELPHDKTGSKNAIQAIGSSQSYGQRYTAIALLNLTTTGADDDGNGGPVETITEQQRDDLQKMIDNTGSDIQAFCAHFKIEALSALPIQSYGQATSLLQKKGQIHAAEK